MMEGVWHMNIEVKDLLISPVKVANYYINTFLFGFCQYVIISNPWLIEINFSHFVFQECQNKETQIYNIIHQELCCQTIQDSVPLSQSLCAFDFDLKPTPSHVIQSLRNDAINMRVTSLHTASPSSLL